MTWQLLTSISVLGLSFSVILQRKLLFKDKIDPFAYATVFQGLVGILLIGFTLLVTQSLALPGIEKVWLPALIAVIAYGVGHVLYAKTLQKVEASAFSVLFATQSIWIMTLGLVLFDETLTILQILGTVLILCAVVVLSKNLKSLIKQKGIAVGLLTGLVFGVAITAWSYVGRHTDTLAWAAVSFVLTSLASLLIRPATYKMIGSVVTGRLMPKLTLLAVFYGVGSVAMLYAYREGAFTIVTPLRQTGIIVTTLLALLLITSERNNILRKIIAACLGVLGAFLIVY